MCNHICLQEKKIQKCNVIMFFHIFQKNEINKLQFKQKGSNSLVYFKLFKRMFLTNASQINAIVQEFYNKLLGRRFKHDKTQNKKFNPALNFLIKTNDGSFLVFILVSFYRYKFITFCVIQFKICILNINKYDYPPLLNTVPVSCSLVGELL